MKIYEIGPYFYKHYWKKYNLMKMEMNIYTEYLLAMKIDEKGHTGWDLIFEEKRQKAIEKKLGCKFIRIRLKKAMMHNMKPVEYKHLSVNLKTEN